MRWVGILSALWIGLSNSASSQTKVWAGSDIPPVDSMCQRFQQLYTQIREETVLPDSARKLFSDIMFGLRGKFQTAEPFRIDSVRRDSLLRSGYFSFPLRNYTSNAIGGTHGEGYRAKGFDLFDYNVRGSHPAQDIFIADRNQDCIDDNTDRPADVLAMTSGWYWPSKPPGRRGRNTGVATGFGSTIRCSTVYGITPTTMPFWFDRATGCNPGRKSAK
jgi:hypothetical protein